MAAQLGLALDNLEAVLGDADMTLANVVRLNAYTTDVDELFKRASRCSWPSAINGVEATAGRCSPSSPRSIP
jgi:enamine deaminase RidA (YjgF/YER057c/UK114 family)